jgi:DNA (cytosine-5)-methyltransferase 1
MNTPRIGSLCAGTGGLDMAVEAVLGGELAWVSDIDKGACKLLAHRYPDVPNLGDFTKTDWATVEPVEILTAGFPCQPVSNAGKQRGDLDERWLWDDVLNAIRNLRPSLVLLENVRGLLTAGHGRLFGRVLGSLADIGYDTQWHGLRAAEVGAPHNRFRVFIVAPPNNSTGLGSVRGLEPFGRDVDGCGRADGPGAPSQPPTLLPTPAVNDMGEGKTVDAWDEWTAKMKAAHGNGNGHGKSLAIEAQRLDQWGRYAEAVARWEQVSGRRAPKPTQDSPTGNPQLAPAFVEWMMGLPAGWVTGSWPGSWSATDVPDLTRREMLKLLGNGVVPQQAAAALRIMLNRAEVAA